MKARTIIDENLAALAAKRVASEQIGEVGRPLRFYIGGRYGFRFGRLSRGTKRILTNAVGLLRNLMRQWVLYKLL